MNEQQQVEKSKAATVMNGSSIGGTHGGQPSRVNPFHAMTYPSGQSPVIEFDNASKGLHQQSPERQRGGGGAGGPLKRLLSASASATDPVDDEPTLSPEEQVSQGIDPMLTIPGQSTLVPAVHIKRVSKDRVELVPANESEVSARVTSNGGDVQHVGIRDKLLGRVGKAFGFGHESENVGERNGGPVVGRSNPPVDHRAGGGGPDFSPQPIGDDDVRDVGGTLPPSPPISENELDPLDASSNDARATTQRRSQSPPAPHSLLTGNGEGEGEGGHGLMTAFTDEPEAMTPTTAIGSNGILEAPITLAPPISIEPKEPSPGAAMTAESSSTQYTSVPGPAGAALNPAITSSFAGWTGPTRSGSIAAVKKRTPSGVAATAASGGAPSSSQTRAASASVAEQSIQASPSMLPQPLPRSSFSSTTSTLAPPSQAIRRNTFTNASFASTSTSNARIPLTHSVSQSEIPGVASGSRRQKVEVPGLDGSALDWDIVAETERLRRERLSRRQKKKTPPVEFDGSPEAAGGLATNEDQTLPLPPPPRIVDAQASPKSGQRKMSEREQEQERVLVGNLIGEDHVNFVLMYNMLTGIRIGVSRCQAKLKRPLTDEDYTARHKFSFDIVGNELTPSARYDFKFKDYAPWVFRELREEHFHLDPADYLLSLTAKYILSELGSPGKSGSFFYFSRDYRFIIKTISHTEHKFLRSILKDYHEHIKTNPHTLLSRFYGLHRVKLPRGRKIHFVIMNNIFPPHRDVHETYDLKGSAWGRETSEEKLAQNPKATLKDLNWLHRGRVFELGPEKRALLSEQLRRDMTFLKRLGIIDYSLLIGIHNMERGNRDNIREHQLSVFHPDVGNLQHRRKPSSVKAGSDAAAMRKAIRRSDPKALMSASSELPTHDSADRRHFLFYQDEGGLRTTDEANQPLDAIYYLGVIDILTPYTNVKRLEHFWKSFTEDKHMISCVPPDEYGDRFIRFLLSFMRGADTSSRPNMNWPRREHRNRADEQNKEKIE